MINNNSIVFFFILGVGGGGVRSGSGKGHSLSWLKSKLLQSVVNLHSTCPGRIK